MAYRWKTLNGVDVREEYNPEVSDSFAFSILALALMFFALLFA